MQNIQFHFSFLSEWSVVRVFNFFCFDFQKIYVYNIFHSNEKIPHTPHTIFYEKMKIENICRWVKWKWKNKENQEVIVIYLKNFFLFSVGLQDV